MHSPPSLAVGYKKVVTHGRRAHNDVVTYRLFLPRRWLAFLFLPLFTHLPRGVVLGNQGFRFPRFSATRLPVNGVLGSLLPASNTQATPKTTHFGDAPPLIGEYATYVTDKGTL